MWTSHNANEAFSLHELIKQEQIYDHVPLAGLMPVVYKHRTATEGGPRQYTLWRARPTLSQGLYTYQLSLYIMLIRVFKKG